MQRGKIVFTGNFWSFLVIFLSLSVITVISFGIVVGIFWWLSAGFPDGSVGSPVLLFLGLLIALVVSMTLGFYQYYWSFKYFFTHMEVEIPSTSQQSVSYPKIHSLNKGV